MKKGKLSNTLLFIFYLLAIVVVVYPFTESYDTSKRYFLLCGLGLMIITLFVRFGVDKANRKKAIKAYVPMRNVVFEKSTDTVFVAKGKTVYPKDYSEVYINPTAVPSICDDNNVNILPESKNDVTVLHIDNVDENKVVIKLFKEAVSVLDYLKVINS